LLDVEDMDVASPDEKSVITYTMEYFLRFASESLREAAAKQAADWLKFLRTLRDLENDYERRARLLIEWSGTVSSGWDSTDFGTSKEEAVAVFNSLRSFVTSEKPPQEGEKMDLETLFAEIQTTRKVNGLVPYAPPADVTPEKVDESFQSLAEKQATHGSKVREARFKFIEKKEDKSGEELQAQINESFKHYDANGNGNLNKTEFLAACMEMGIALKTEDEKDALFSQVSEGNEELTLEQFTKWMEAHLLVKLDDPESIKNAFKTLADGGQGLTDRHLGTNPLSDEDREYMMSAMPKTEDGLYDYNAFVSSLME